MITTLFLNIFLTFVNYILGLLPTSTFDSSVTTGITAFFNSVYQYNNILPIDTAFTLLGYTAVFWGIIFLWDIFHWLIKLLRGQ